jgi:hypothetical protein
MSAGRCSSKHLARQPLQHPARRSQQRRDTFVGTGLILPAFSRLPGSSKEQVSLAATFTTASLSDRLMMMALNWHERWRAWAGTGHLPDA